MTRRIALVQGHPDAAEHHLLHAMSDAYAEGTLSAGHQVRRIEVARLEFPLLRSQADFEAGALPSSLTQAQEDMRWAEHWVFLFPLWHGTMPALLKGFLEQILRPGFAMEYKKSGFPKRLLAGRSARIVVTMGMPAWIYRWYFGAYGLRSFERSMLSFAGIKPIREFVVSFGFILVVNAPQNMVAYGTETFEARDFVRTGLVLTLVAFGLVMLLGATYWRWLGYM